MSCVGNMNSAMKKSHHPGSRCGAAGSVGLAPAAMSGAVTDPRMRRLPCIGPPHQFQD